MTPSDASVPWTWIVGEDEAHARTALDHVLLSLSYLEDADVDGYLSLLRPDVLVCLPDGRTLAGHDEVAGEAGRALRPLRASGVVAVGRCVVVATGTVDPPDGGAAGVADLYVLDRDGLIRSCHRAATGRG